MRLGRERLDRERLADGIVHALGTVGALAGGVSLIVMTARSTVPGQLLPVIAYVTGLLLSLGCSAAYHLLPRSRHREWLRRFDHAAIFALIAGTYTPVAVLALGPPWDVALTAAVWTAAAAGMILKLARPRAIERISVALYLVLGWIGVIALRPLIAALGGGPLLLILGGALVYSGGVVFHLSSRRFHAALWHASVLVAASFHFAAVVSLVQP